MLRHKRSVHHQEESDTSETEQSVLEDSDETESDDEEAVAKFDPWDSLIQKTFEQCQDEFEERVNNLTQKRHMDQEEAQNKAFKELQPLYRKALMTLFTSRLTWFNAMQTDPIYKTIRHTAKGLMEMEDYSRDEAWKYAISKRKYILDTILEEFESPKMGEEDQSEPKNDEPPTKRLKV